MEHYEIFVLQIMRVFAYVFVALILCKKIIWRRYQDLIIYIVMQIYISEYKLLLTIYENSGFTVLVIQA